MNRILRTALVAWLATAAFAQTKTALDTKAQTAKILSTIRPAKAR